MSDGSKAVSMPPAEAAPRLDVQNLVVYYGESLALRGISLQVFQGEVVCLLGRNGAGKTSTLRALVGVLPKRQGTITLNGLSAIGLLPEAIAHLGVAYCPEERGIFASLSAQENLTLPPILGPGVLSWGWALTSLPLFIWMGDILFRSNLSANMFEGLAPWVSRLPGRLLHVNVLGCGIMAGVAGSSAVTCATIGRMSVPELTRQNSPIEKTIGTLAGSGMLGLLIPPSIIMIVYGVTANVSIAQLFIAGVIPGLLLSGLFMAYTIVSALLHPDQIPPADQNMSFLQKLAASRHLIPVVALIAAVLGSIYTGLATATEAAGLGVVGAMIIAAIQGEMNWKNFRDSLLGATRLYCRIALILAGAAFLTLSMGYIGLPRHLAEWIGSLGLSPFALVLALMAFFIILGCFRDPELGG